MLAGCACERGPPSPPYSGASRRTLAASVSAFDAGAQATQARAAGRFRPEADASGRARTCIPQGRALALAHARRRRARVAVRSLGQGALGGRRRTARRGTAGNLADRRTRPLLEPLRAVAAADAAAHVASGDARGRRPRAVRDRDGDASALPARAVEPASPPPLRRRTPALRDPRDTALLRRGSAAPAGSARVPPAHPVSQGDGARGARRPCACRVVRLRARTRVLTRQLTCFAEAVGAVRGQ